MSLPSPPEGTWWEVSDNKSVESALHTAFASRRVHGEWFHLSDQDVKDLELKMMAGIAINSFIFKHEPIKRSVPSGFSAAEVAEKLKASMGGGTIDFNDARQFCRQVLTWPNADRLSDAARRRLGSFAFINRVYKLAGGK